MKIAQRFNVGAIACTPNRVPLRDERNDPIGLCEQKTFLPSLVGLLFLLIETQR